mgnify:FL=1
MIRHLLLILLAITGLHAENPFRVPEGFEIAKFAGDDLTHDTWAMTISRDGKVAVSGPGYIKVLLDTDNDGVADQAEVVFNKARNPHGLLWNGDDLLSVQPEGIFLHRTPPGETLPGGDPELFYKLPGGGGEHGPHGIRRGPDGWFYVACGNNTNISKGNITTATSPITDPSQGTILRISPDGKQSEVIAHGFRNQYDLAFNQHGHLFTFDSDGERDHQLPWYSYCRVFHIRVGGHHGWLLPGHQRSFNRPPYFFDSATRLNEIDRGSPTGVEVYRHTQFPEHYQDGLFFACWTYGRVYFSPLTPKGDSYESHDHETFLEPVGNLGFAPSDLAVHPLTGDLFVSVGGRGTRGSVYRVSYPNGRKAAEPVTLYETPRDWSIHKDRITAPAPLSPDQALTLFERAKDPSTRLNAIRHLMLIMGDISTNEAQRRIDAGYTANRPDALAGELRRKVISLLTEAFDPQDPGHPQQYEIARLLAMLKADTKAAMEGLASALSPTTHPTHDAHYLFCLSQMPGPREAIREKIAEGFLGIDRKIDERNLLTDRNWSVNLRDALKAQLEFDPGTVDRIARFKKISPSSVHLLSLLPEKDHRSLARAMSSATRGWNRDALNFLEKHMPLPGMMPLLAALRDIWKSAPRLRPDLVGFLTRHGTEEDRKIASEFQRAPSRRIDLTPFAEKMKVVDWEKGDSSRGQATYARYNCTTCHSGNRRLGPSLKNIARRFNRDDLFRHINEPNLSISDLYKATQITTAEGVYIGVKVYSSEAQTILETGSNETIRFSRHDILNERSPNQSPMPAGLLLGASTQELADLYAFLQKL